MAHPCIKALCIGFYYHGCGKPRKSVAYAFRDDFKTSVPEYAVALAATCVSISSNVVKFMNCKERLISFRYIHVWMNSKQVHFGA